MKSFFKNYKQTIILLASIIIGAIVGLIFKEDAKVLSPFGDIFINLMLMKQMKFLENMELCLYLQY